MTQDDLLFQRAARHAARTSCARRSPRARTRSPTPQIAAYYNKNKSRFAHAREARPPHRADQDQGQGRRRPARRSKRGQSFSVGRQEVLDRPGLQGQRRHARRRRQGPAGEGARRRDLQGARRASSPARSRRSSATTSSRSRRSRRPRSRRSTQAKATIKQLLPRSEPAEGARRRSSRTSEKKWKDKTDCRKGYVDRRLQERAEGQGRRRPRPPRRRASSRRTSAGTDHAAAGSRRRVPDRTPDAQPPPRSRALDELTRRLRVECPWDREQDERSIVPHTVEEAYELADAAHARRRRQAARRARRRPLPGPLPLAAARGARRRRPGAVAEHVPPEARSAATRTSSARSRSTSAGEVLRNWDAIKQTEAGREPGIFGEVPENLPALLLRAQGPAPRGVHRASTSTTAPLEAVAGRARGAWRPPATTATRASRRSATCCSPRSTSRASSRSTPSSRCASSAGSFRARVEAPRSSRPSGATLERRSRPSASSATTRRRD